VLGIHISISEVLSCSTRKHQLFSIPVRSREYSEELAGSALRGRRIDPRLDPDEWNMRRYKAIAEGVTDAAKHLSEYTLVRAWDASRG
jgi:CDP-diacylglycerol pyrophosphatase